MTPAQTSAVVRVGDGRGFLVDAEGHLGRLVVTAAHCLPHLPPAHSASYPYERSYPNLVGALGVEPTLLVECLFVDPIADVAVLGGPDNQAFCDEDDAYDEFVEARSVLRIGVFTAPCEASVLTLDGRWVSCTVRLGNPYGPANRLTLIGAGDGNAAGTSGSPIVNVDGRALGLISVGMETIKDGRRLVETEAHGQPVLASTLPLWLLGNLRVDTKKATATSRQWKAAVRAVFPPLNFDEEGRLRVPKVTEEGGA